MEEEIIAHPKNGQSRCARCKKPFLYPQRVKQGGDGYEHVNCESDEAIFLRWDSLLKRLASR